ncbi:type II toxin-antitoxin system RelE family toxin [Blastococcus sp. SYSU DS0973]
MTRSPGSPGTQLLHGGSDAPDLHRRRPSAAAERAIELDLPEPVAGAVVDFLYGPLATDPHRVGNPLGFELEGYWSARRGQYRVIYSIHDDQVLVRVVRISHRADAYR